MKLWEFARLFAAMARVNQAFFHKDTKIEWGTLTRPMGNLMRALSPWINSVFVVQLPHKGSNWTDLQRLPQRVFVMFLEDGKLCPPFHNKKIVWENLDIKWIKVPSIYSIVHNDFDVITENDQQFNKGDHQSEDWVRHRPLLFAATIQETAFPELASTAIPRGVQGFRLNISVLHHHPPRWTDV